MANDLPWTAQGNYNLQFRPRVVPSTISRVAGYRWFVQFSLLSRLFLNAPSTSFRRGRAKGPFVIPTLNIFLKTRFRPDFAPIRTGSRARSRMMKFHVEEFRVCSLLSLRNEDLELSNYGRSDTVTNCKCCELNHSSRLIMSCLGQLIY